MSKRYSSEGGKGIAKAIDLNEIQYKIANIEGLFVERIRLITKLEKYFELTKMPGDNGVEQNPEWDAGFQAALSLLKAELK